MSESVNCKSRSHRLFRSTSSGRSAMPDFSILLGDQETARFAGDSNEYLQRMSVSAVACPATTFVITRSKSRSDKGPASLTACGAFIVGIPWQLTSVRAGAFYRLGGPRRMAYRAWRLPEDPDKALTHPLGIGEPYGLAYPGPSIGWRIQPCFLAAAERLDRQPHCPWSKSLLSPAEAGRPSIGSASPSRSSPY